MKQAQNIISIQAHKQHRNQGRFKGFKSVIMSKDQWLGECLDDFLFKLCGTDQVVWIPKHMLQHSPTIANAFVVLIGSDQLYCCAKLMLSNTIRMCLIDQHQINGFQLLPFLIESPCGD